MSNPDPNFNPYAAPISAGPVKAGRRDTNVEAYRRKYLNHEASIRSFGMLYLIGFVFAVIGIVVVINILLTGVTPAGGRAPEATMLGLFLLVFYIVAAGLNLASGLGLRRLEPWGRITATVMGAIGLLGFPIGTLISAYLLYLLWSEKGTVVFSEKYKRVREQTPHIQYKTSFLVWILLALVLILFSFAVLGAVFGR